MNKKKELSAICMTCSKSYKKTIHSGPNLCNECLNRLTKNNKIGVKNVY